MDWRIQFFKEPSSRKKITKELTRARNRMIKERGSLARAGSKSLVKMRIIKVLAAGINQITRQRPGAVLGLGHTCGIEPSIEEESGRTKSHIPEHRARIGADRTKWPWRS